ncbi:hypothetical protein L0E83_08840 [Marichromatium gracile]|uniref:hypothetical protein n=1 Tax=Marichromatium gracile TaxID=1048 RepID=UPI001F2ED117|nr:hypothetical protein [Marichromatium gracile]MCF1183541.1 hypothetical protein [Marichromatium gracile]
MTISRDQAAIVTVDVSYNPDRSGRPWSISSVQDTSRWHEDVRGRVRTFASERAAREFAAAHASGPVAVRVYSKEDQHYGR